MLRMHTLHGHLMWRMLVLIASLYIVCTGENVSVRGAEVDLTKTLVWGPGLKADFFVPARYFFIQAVDTNGDNITSSLGANAFEVNVDHPSESRVRARTQVLDRQDGSYIGRFRLYATIEDMKITILYKGKHVANSPYMLKGMLYHEKCDCPDPSLKHWLTVMKCPQSIHQIKQDLSVYKDIDLDAVAKEAISRFSNAGMHSLCHYKIIDNKIYRKTHGQHVGFKMFSDAILLSITRKVQLPDIEFFVNLGDWPLEKRKVSENPLPIFSWCGSDDTRDIIMPTYDITESTQEMMQRVSLDVLSVMGNSGPAWQNKSDKGFWRGRDSRQERLDLVVMSRAEPELIDAALTHMFFFPKDDKKYGELVKSISFFDFFKHKYQINIDGTVAAYRFPYLLAGDSVVLKHDSIYYEHFYKQLKPYEHYIPFKRDLSDLKEKLQWAKDNDEKAQQISRNGRQFVMDHLLPKNILCYHSKLFQEFSKKLLYKPKPADDTWELVEQPQDHESQCECHWKNKKMKLKDEL